MMLLVNLILLVLLFSFLYLLLVFSVILLKVGYMSGAVEDDYVISDAVSYFDILCLVLCFYV